MTNLEALRDNIKNITIAKSVSIDGEKVPVKSTSYNNAELELYYRGGETKTFSIKSSSQIGNVETFVTDNDLTIQLDNYEDQESAKGEILKQYNKYYGG